MPSLRMEWDSWSSPFTSQKHKNRVWKAGMFKRLCVVLEGWRLNLDHRPGRRVGVGVTQWRWIASKSSLIHRATESNSLPSTTYGQCW
jgi:hypothetical protein